jgi:hypothetical protein
VVPVLFLDNEIEAELARGRFESEGIAAQVRFSARGGYPRYAAGYGGFGVGAPMSTYEVLVDERDADRARRLLGARDRPVAHPGAWRRTIVRVITLLLLASLVAAAKQALQSLF